jgi:hypothetical protein
MWCLRCVRFSVFNYQMDVPNANRASSLGSSRIVQTTRMAFTLTGSGTLENEGLKPSVLPSTQKLHFSQRSFGTASGPPKCVARTFAIPRWYWSYCPHHEIFHPHSEELAKEITSCNFLTASSSLSIMDWCRRAAIFRLASLLLGSSLVTVYLLGVG